MTINDNNTRASSRQMNDSLVQRQGRVAGNSILSRSDERPYRRRTPMFLSVFLVFILMIAISPVSASATNSLTFTPSADAFVKEASPSTNSGTASTLQVNGAGNPGVESYMLFSVSGVTSPIQSATLRVYDTNNATNDGPALYATAATWTETGITWNTRPARTSAEIGNQTAIAAGSWAEYDVTSIVTGDGSYSFALVADSADGATFSSSEGGKPPQLVITANSGSTPTAGPGPTNTPAPNPSPTPFPVAQGTIQHIFVVVMENHSYSQIWNSSSAPYITQLGKSYARATNYHALDYPSLPNYLDLYGGSNYGITTDCKPSSTCHINATNLADNLEANRLTWKGYMESMPTPCTLNNVNNYAPRHDPFIYFDNIRNNTARCNSHVVPYSELATDLASKQTTPNYSMIVPNVCNDMHDCSISTGDKWLKNNIPAILNSPACTVDKCLLILTFDEDDSGHNNNVLTIFAGSGAKTGGVTSSVAYSHYSLLRTVEDIFGLPTQTKNDAEATPMNDLLN